MPTPVRPSPFQSPVTGTSVSRAQSNWISCALASSRFFRNQVRPRFSPTPVRPLPSQSPVMRRSSGRPQSNWIVVRAGIEAVLQEPGVPPAEADTGAAAGVPVADEGDVVGTAPVEDDVGCACRRLVAQDEGAAAAHADADLAVAVPVAHQRHVAGLAEGELGVRRPLGLGGAEAPGAVLERQSRPARPSASAAQPARGRPGAWKRVLLSVAGDRGCSRGRTPTARAGDDPADDRADAGDLVWLQLPYRKVRAAGLAVPAAAVAHWHAVSLPRHTPLDPHRQAGALRCSPCSSGRRRCSSRSCRPSTSRRDRAGAGRSWCRRSRSRTRCSRRSRGCRSRSCDPGTSRPPRRRWSGRRT